jgi:hypothetical protein
MSALAFPYVDCTDIKPSNNPKFNFTLLKKDDLQPHLKRKKPNGSL